MKLMTLLFLGMMPAIVQGFASPSVVPPRTSSSKRWASSTASIDKPSTSSGSGEEIVIKSHADWMEFLFDLEEEEKAPPIKVVFFHASWCKFCQRLRLKWNRQRRMCASSAGATFASVEYTANRKLVQSLDIEHFPTIQFYYQDELLHSAPCSPKSFPEVKQRLELFLGMDEEQMEEAVEAWQEGVDINALQP